LTATLSAHRQTDIAHKDMRIAPARRMKGKPRSPCRCVDTCGTGSKCRLPAYAFNVPAENRCGVIVWVENAIYYGVTASKQFCQSASIRRCDCLSVSRGLENRIGMQCVLVVSPLHFPSVSAAVVLPSRRPTQIADAVAFRVGIFVVSLQSTVIFTRLKRHENSPCDIHAYGLL